jgi:hypothetical protein
MRKESSLLHSTLFSSIGIYTEYVFGMVVSILIARHLQPAGFGSAERRHHHPRGPIQRRHAPSNPAGLD